MSGDIGETFVDYALVQDVEKAHNAGVFEDMGVDGEDEQRYISELKRRVTAFDEKSVYVAIKVFVTHHWDTLTKALKYIKKEGENINDNGTDT